MRLALRSRRLPLAFVPILLVAATLEKADRGAFVMQRFSAPFAVVWNAVRELAASQSTEVLVDDQTAGVLSFRTRGGADEPRVYMNVVVVRSILGEGAVVYATSRLDRGSYVPGSDATFFQALSERVK
jgi:hypothetical protein